MKTFDSRFLRIIDAAKCDHRKTVMLAAHLWDDALPLVRAICGTDREMYKPWRAFLFDGIWVERAKS